MGVAVRDAVKIDLPLERAAPPRRSWGRSVFEALLILVCAGLLAGIFHSQREGGIDLGDAAVYIPVGQIDRFESVLWVDARTREEYETKHVAGASLLNLDDWEALLFPLLEKWQPDQTILVYCGSAACFRSLQVAKRLRTELGTEEVYAIAGGWDGLLASGVAMESQRP